MTTIRDVALRKIKGGYIVSHSEISDSKEGGEDDGPCCMPRSKYNEEFFTSEEEAGKRVANLAPQLDENSRY